MGGTGGGFVKTYAVVFRLLTWQPCNDGTEHARYSPTRLRFMRVMFAARHCPCIAPPTRPCDGFSVSLVTKCCTFGRRDYTPSTAQDFDLRAQVQCRAIHSEHIASCLIHSGYNPHMYTWWSMATSVFVFLLYGITTISL